MNKAAETELKRGESLLKRADRLLNGGPVELKYSPDQPRDYHGRFGSGGVSGDSQESGRSELAKHAGSSYDPKLKIATFERTKHGVTGSASVGVDKDGKFIVTFDQARDHQSYDSAKEAVAAAKNYVESGKVPSELIKNPTDANPTAKEEFIRNFSEDIGSAAEVWMSPKQIGELQKLHDEGQHKFRAAQSQLSVDRLVKNGWKLFAAEKNYDNYDAVLYKPKK